MSIEKKNLKDIRTFLQSKKDCILELTPVFYATTIRFGILLKRRKKLCRDIVVKKISKTYTSKILHQAKTTSGIVITAIRPM